MEFAVIGASKNRDKRKVFLFSDDAVNIRDDHQDWLAWIVIGGIAGWIASIITKNNARMGLIANIIVGIIGGFVGGFLMSLIGAQGLTGFNLWSLLVSVIGASVLLWVISLIRRG